MALRATPLTPVDVLNRVCVLAMHSGRHIGAAGHAAARRLIQAGVTDPEAILAEVRATTTRTAEAA